MDSFDDLLTSSRNALEDNPFSDPFAKRPDSPDPWASPFAQPDVYGSSSVQSEADDRSEPDTDVRTEAESTHSEPPPDSESKEPTAPETDKPDPLDAAIVNADDEDDSEDNEPLGRRLPISSPDTQTPTTPGFRDMSATTSSPSEPPFSEIATIRPTEPEETIPETEPIPRSLADRFDSGPFGHPDPFSNAASSGWNSEPYESQQPTSSSSSMPVFGGQQRAVDDDSDDDKPISQIAGSRRASMSPKQTTPRRPEEQAVFQITVDDPQKVGNPIGSYIMYTVHTRTTSTAFQKSAFSVLRRYSDFLWLYETLSNNNPGVVVPPVPDKNAIGRFDDTFVKQRRFALEKCITKMANHPVLGKDDDLRLFLESDTFSLDIKHRKAEIAHERGGLMASLGQTLAGPKFYENDEWFDKQKGYLDSLETQLKGLVKAIELVSRQRSDLSAATGELVNTVTELASSDIGKPLAQSLAGLADVEKKAQDLQVIQSEQDMVTLLGTVDEYARKINSVRLAFNSRIRTYYAWKISESDCAKTKQAHEKNKAQGRIVSDRMGYSLAQIAEAERRALDARHEFEHVSKLIKAEMGRFEKERVEDLKNSLHAFLEGMIERQKELIATWQVYQQMLLKRSGQTGQTPITT